MIAFSAALAIVLIMFIVGASYEQDEVSCGLMFIVIAVSAMYGMIFILF